MRRIAAVAVLIVVISALGGATGAAAQEGTSEGDEKVVLRIGSSNDIDGFNPFKVVEVPSKTGDKVKQGDNVQFSFTSSGKDHVITDMK